MTSNVKDWIASLDARNVIDVEIEIQDGQVLGFSLNYRAFIGGRWVEVVRYDTDHGHLHIHRNWRKGQDAVTPLEDPDAPAPHPDAPAPPYNEAFTRAEADLKANWQRYRAKMERMVTRHD